MYLYYDSNGVLQEQINDSAIVQGETCNIIYCYFAGLDLTSKSFQLTLTRVSSGTSTRTIDGVVTPNVTIPYNSKRDLRYFQYYYPNGTNTGYTMVAFALNSATDLTTSDTYAGNPLISGSTSDFYEPITFNVESNHITANEAITSSQYTYLLALAKGTIYANGISLSLANSVLTASIDDGKGGSSSSDVTLPYLPIEGGTMSGQLNMSDKLIVGTFTSEGLTEGYDLSIVGVSFNYSYTGTQKQILYGLDRITFNPNGTLTSGNEYIMHFPSESGYSDFYVRPLTEADRLNYSFTQAETAISEDVTAGAGTYSIVYGLARISNGKLNIVVFGKVTITADLTISTRSRFTGVDIPISANVGSHIFPISGAQYDAIDYKQADLFRISNDFPPTGADFTKKIYFGINKSISGVSLGLGIALGSGTIPVGSYAFRIEENITL
jgi:hypothetical protein